MKPDTPRDFFFKLKSTKERFGVVIEVLDDQESEVEHQCLDACKAKRGKIETINSVQIDLNKIVRDRKGT